MLSKQEHDELVKQIRAADAAGQHDKAEALEWWLGHLMRRTSNDT